MQKKFSCFVLVFLFVFALCLNSQAKSEGEFIDYHFVKGYLELYNGDFKDAAVDLWRVFPFVKSDDFYQELADILVYVGRYSEAQYVLQRAIKIYPNDKEFYYKLFDVYTIEGKKREAFKVMKEIQKRFQETENTFRRIITMYIKSGRYEDAYRKLEIYVKRYKNDPSGYYLLAQVCLRLKKDSCAFENAKRALKLAPQNYQYLIFLAGLYERRGEFDKAIELYKKLPQNALTYFVIANDYYMAQDLKNAATYYKKAFLASHRVDYLERLAYVLLNLNDLDEIVSMKQKFSKLFGESDRLKLVYAIALSEKGKCNEALKEFSSINPKVGFYSDVVSNEAECLCKLGRFEELREKLAKVGNVKSYLFVIGKFCLKNKEFKRALVLFDDAFKVAKNNKERAYIYFYEADLYFSDLKDTDKAIELLNKAIKLYPKYAGALNYLGYLYIDKNIDVKRGMNLVKRALKIDKDNPYYLDSLGWGYYKLGEYKKAEVYLKKAIESYARSDLDARVVSLEHLLEVYKAEHMYDEARRVAEDILKLKPKDEKALKFLKQSR